MNDPADEILGTDPIVLAAFEGWNDAGSAATQALGHLHDTWGASVVESLDPEEYHDFQVTRPIVGPGPDGREITWPTTHVALATTPSGREVVLVHGIEPSMRWRRYSREVLDLAEKLGAQTVVTLGALLADVPHTRPIPVSASSEDPALRAALGLEPSSYEGPTGIVGVIGHEASARGLASLALWAAVPHYVAQPPSPKATVALLARVESLIGETVTLGDLPEEAQAWQVGVDELAEEDVEISEYVQQLEEAKDTAELPEASGEAIAQEFERYLRRREPGEKG